MLESEREKLNEINRELMVANTDYGTLQKKLSKIGGKIFKLKKKIDDLLNGKEK